MNHILKTTAVDECSGFRDELVNMLDLYARDQLAFIRHCYSQQNKSDCMVRSKVYSDLAKELREIRIEQE